MLLPLVAFDKNGNRIGMGGGFYDHTLAYLNIRKVWRKPKLIGLAHELQKVKQLQSNPWDIPLDGVVTEKEFRYYKKFY
jgi:5-formyltetrahydrofolate cyclo-ligase